MFGIPQLKMELNIIKRQLNYLSQKTIGYKVSDSEFTFCMKGNPIERLNKLEKSISLIMEHLGVEEKYQSSRTIVKKKSDK